MKIFSILFSALAIFAVIYFSEVNRQVLLFAIYPTIFFGFLGIIAYYERKMK